MAGRAGSGEGARDGLVELPVGPELWERVFTVAPLVLVGTKEAGRLGLRAQAHGDAARLGGLLLLRRARPRHATYRNVQAHPQFTVSFPRPEQILESSFAAGGRFDGDAKPTLAAVPTVPARVVDGRVVEGCALYLECELERIVDGFGPNSLIVGRVVAASAARDALRGAEVDDADLVHRLGLLAYLAPGRFAVVRDSLVVPVSRSTSGASAMAADRGTARCSAGSKSTGRRWSSCSSGSHGPSRRRSSPRPSAGRSGSSRRSSSGSSYVVRPVRGGRRRRPPVRTAPAAAAAATRASS